MVRTDLNMTEPGKILKKEKADEMEIPVGIVLYNPQIERLRENISAVYAKASRMIVIDNASENKADIQELMRQYDRIEYIRNGQNLGIAKALNQICMIAREWEASFVMTLDQDSVCPEDILEKYERYLSLDRLGILCPQIRDRNGGLQESGCLYKNSYKKADRKIVVVRRCISSASLVSLKAWEAVNGFDEVMFIDGVDHDFCERIRQKGYRIYRLTQVVLLHEIGSMEERHFLIWRVFVKNHSSFRKYYIARNTIYLARKRRSAGLILKSYLQIMKQFLIILVYEHGKKEKLRAVIKGAADGMILQMNERWKY